MTWTRRSHRVALLAGMFAALFALASAGTAVACGPTKPKRLSFHRSVGKLVGRLTWKVPARHSGRYRVYRDGAVVGQTVQRSLRVAVRPGRTYVFTVRVVSKRGRPTKCAGSMSRKIGYYAPFRPHGIAIRNVTRRSAKLVWSAARRGDGHLAGYRVFRDGVVYRQVKKRWLTIKLTSARTYRFAVAAADTRGRLSPLSRVVSVRSGHHGPGVPRSLRAVRVTDTNVGLAWTAGRRKDSRIVGYRIFRNGSMFRQVTGLSGDVPNLAPATGYRFTVAAVDSLGYLSPQTGAIAVTTALPQPTQGRIHAFLLATTGESFRDLQRHYTQIGTIYPTYFDCAPVTGALRGVNDPLVTGWAQLRRIAVLPRFDCQRPAALHLILTDPATRAATINGLVSLVNTFAYDGINIDFEAGAPEDRDALVSFTRDLAAQLHAIGKRLTIEVSAKWTNTTTGRSGFYDYARLGALADNVFVMAWGWHWSTSPPGPSDEISNVVKVADYVASMPNKSRFLLGSPLYGHDWPNGGGSSNPSTPKEYAAILDLIRRFGGTPVLDPSSDTWHYTYTDVDGTHDVWYGDASTLGTRIRVAKSRGLGLGLWRLGEEDQRFWLDPLVAPAAVWP